MHTLLIQCRAGFAGGGAAAAAAPKEEEKVEEEEEEVRCRAWVSGWWWCGGSVEPCHLRGLFSIGHRWLHLHAPEALLQA